MGELLNNIWSVYLDTATWLLLGLIAAGLVKAYMPEDAMQKWLGGSGLGAVGRAALLGAPLPLCSCGVLPAALGMRRAGASKEATVSFLISTPETSIDSVAVTYALIGPVMAIYRPVAALASAIITGVMVSFIREDAVLTKPVQSTACSSQAAGAASCCEVSLVKPQAECCSAEANEEVSRSSSRLRHAIRFAGADLLDDISRWLAFGIVVAGIMLTIIPDGWLAQWGQGLTAMLVMLLVGIPMYICAAASTPVAAGLLVAGVSPGAVLVFLLVGPATNIAGLMLVRQELGTRVTLVYLLGIALVSILMGLLLNWGLASLDVQIQTSMQHQHSVLPDGLALVSAILLLLLVIPGIRNRLMPFFASNS